MTVPETMAHRRPVPANDPRYAEHRQRLQDERRFRVAQLADLEAETPVSPRHESVTRLLHVSASVALAEIDTALARIAEGRYGLCLRCGEPIDAERLAVLPMAPWCMSCHYNEQNCRLAAMSSPGRA